MELLYIENYLIFSVFLVLFMLEIGIAILSLMRHESYVKKFKNYLVSIWGINGTFAIFYLVDMEATYPKLLATIGSAYAVPILFGALFFIVRNAFLVYSEMTNHKRTEKSYIRLYAISVIVIAFIALTTLSSTVSGIGINIWAGSINLGAFLFNPFSIMLFIAVAFLSFYFASLYFRVVVAKGMATVLGVLAFALVLAALYLCVPSVWANVVSNTYAVAAAVLLFVVGSVASALRVRYSKYILFVAMLLLVNLFGVVEYPYLFGGAAQVQSYLPATSEGNALLAISAIGGIFLVLSLAYLFKLAHDNR